MSNRFIAVQPGTDPNQQLAIINKNFAELDNESVKKLFYDNNGVPSIQIGVQQDGTSRIRVAKAGVDVTTATDAQLSFNSAQNAFKIVQTGTITGIPVTGSSVSATYTHGLGYVPVALVYMTDAAGTITNPLPDFGGPSIGTALGFTSYFYYEITATTLTITMILATGSSYAGATFFFKYYLLQETAR